jgi:hypothetical protein
MTADRFIAFDRISLSKQRIKVDDEDELVVSAARPLSKSCRPVVWVD